MKCTLLDGPESGEEFEIERAPLFLRITHNGTQSQALDKECQEPNPTDIVYIYLREGSQRQARTENSANYHLHTEYPKDCFVMENHSWRGWVSRQPETIAALNK
jgi:hypothetical protein